MREPSMPKKAMRQPIPAKSAPNQKAIENPWLSAFVISDGVRPCAPMNLVVAETAIVERTATPRAPPICCVVVIKPDATPASSWATPLIAPMVTGTNERPRPTPAKRNPGSNVPR